MLAFVTLAVVSQPPPVSVQAEDEILRGALLQRLLESGRRVVPPTDSDASHFVVRSLRHSILVDVSQQSHRRSIELDRTEPSVLRLELVHRAIGVERSLPQTDGEARPSQPSASLRFVGFEPRPEHYAHATSRLLAGGFDVVGRDHAGDFAVCVWAVGGGFVAARTDGARCSGESPNPAGRRRTLQEAVSVEAEAEAFARTEALARMVSESLPPAVERPDTPAEVAPAPKQSRWEVVVRLDGGVQVRRGGLDGAAGAQLDGHRGLWGVSARAEFVPFVDRAQSLTIVESFVGVGPSIGGALSQRVRLRAHVLGGLLVHRHRSDIDGPGHRVDVQASVPVIADIELGRGVGLHLLAAVGIAGRQRSHHRGDQPLWSRGALRFGVMAGLRYRWSMEGREQ